MGQQLPLPDAIKVLIVTLPVVIKYFKQDVVGEHADRCRICVPPSAPTESLPDHVVAMEILDDGPCTRKLSIVSDPQPIVT